MKTKKLELGPVLVVPRESQNITREKLISMLPKKTNVSVTDAMLRTINSMEEDTGLPQNLMEEDLMSYMYLLGKGKKLSVEQLINAIKFCNLKRNVSNVKAWAIVFPDKYDRLISEGKTIDNHVSMYSGSWLVQKIDEEMLMPVHMQYAAAFHKAMGVNMKMMMGDGGLDADDNPIPVTAMVRHLAAKTVLEVTRQPETAKIDIMIGQSDETLAVQERQAVALEQIIANQQVAFRKGNKAIDVQTIHHRIDKQSSSNVDEDLNDV